MQVSWIDPDEVRELLRQIEGPRTGTNISAWEVHTLPAAPAAKQAEEPLLADARPPDFPLPEAPLNETRPGPANAELWRIRERLRALRDKAQTAGILTRSPSGDTSPSPQEGGAETQAPIAPAEAPPAPAAHEAATEVPAPAPMEAIGPVEAVLPTQPQEEALVPQESPFNRSDPAPAYEPLFATPARVSDEPPTPPEAMPCEEEPPNATQVAEEPQAGAAGMPFVVSNLGLSERLNAVAGWASERLGTREILLVDDYGDVLWGAQGQTALVLSAMMAWHSTQRASASATCTDSQRIDKALGPGRSLTVLPVRTRYGVVSLAVIQSLPVGEDDAAAIRDALAQAVEGPADAPTIEGA